MKELKLKVIINRSSKEVFDFVLNPNNTPIWIDSIVHEETDKWPVKVGGTYRNQNKEKTWSSYKVIAFQKDKMFEFLKDDNNYHVRYTLTDKSNSSCELEYYEWVKKGDLDDPFTIDILYKLKNILEK